MADTNEVFRNLEDATGEGIAHVGKAPGAAQSTDEQAPVLPCVDDDGNLQNIPLKQEADNTTANTADAIPVMAFEDSSGNLTYPALTADGKIPVSQDAAGTLFPTYGASATGVVNTIVEVAIRAIGNSESYICSLGSASCTKACKWELVHDDNGSKTVLETLISGPGSFDVKFELKQEFSSGATGTQRLIIQGTQLRGPATDLYASVTALEL